MNSKVVKGLVMEVKKYKVIVITSCGEFREIKLGKYVPKIGEEYSGVVYEKRNFYTKPLIAACMIFAILFTIGVKSYYTEAAQVIVNINPSVKLILNRWDKIIKVEPLNKDGEELLESVAIKNKSLDIGLKKIVEEAKGKKFIDNKYLDSEKVITVIINSKIKNKVNKLTNFKKYIDENKLLVKVNEHFMNKIENDSNEKRKMNGDSKFNVENIRNKKDNNSVNINNKSIQKENSKDVINRKNVIDSKTNIKRENTNNNQNGNLHNNRAGDKTINNNSDIDSKSNNNINRLRGRNNRQNN